jgi:flagellar hook-associated protein 3 FlgL
MTRITDSTMTRGLLRDLDSVRQRLSTSQSQLSSGSRITRPSDDPFGTSQAIGLRGEIATAQQHQRNAGEASAWLSVTDTAMSGLYDVTGRARELLVRGANDTLSADSRAAIATELDTLADAAKAHANATYAGRYVLAGTATGTKPYVAGDDAYHGDAGTVARSIGPGVSVQVNVHGSGVLGDGSANDGLLLSTLRQAAADLRGGSPAQMADLRSTQLHNIDGVTDAISGLAASVGSTTNRVEAAVASLAQIEETATKLLSDVEDADMAETYINLTSQRTAYESALKAGAQIIQPSLLDFLR